MSFKKLGQHFLIDKNKIRKIIDALDLKSDDVVVEIGPGHGELTRDLRFNNKDLRIILIEKDKELSQLLKNKFEDNNKIKIIEGDVLKILPSLFQDYKLDYKLIGNIPYYLTGYLFRTISKLKNKPSLVVFTIQKEVAERIIAKAPKMNLLAASVQYWAESEIIDYISASDFNPPPKVDSAIIRLNIKKQETRNKSDRYYKFIKILFSHPRKTILNNLSSLKDREELKEIFKKQGIKENARPQDLSVEEIIKLKDDITCFPVSSLRFVRD